MAMDPRKRQKKLEKQKAKKKAEKRAFAQRESQGLASRLQAVAGAPLLHCFMSDAIEEGGIGDVLVSRLLPNGQVAFAVFLVDVYCLGVKNTFSGIVPRAQYEERVYDRLRSQYSRKAIKPECARKLVEGAIQYAQNLGLPPHPDYEKSKHIFGDIAAESCTREFTYGKDGKPFFISGPDDDEYRCRHILKSMESHCGPGNYHYLMQVGGSSPIPDDIEQIVEE